MSDLLFADVEKWLDAMNVKQALVIVPPDGPAGNQFVWMWDGAGGRVAPVVTPELRAALVRFVREFGEPEPGGKVVWRKA